MRRECAVSDDLYLEHLLKEYSALSDRLDSYAKSSFEDFKLLAAAAFVVAWPPMAASLTYGSNGFLLFAGFLTVLLVVAAIDARDNLKHSVVRFYMSQAEIYERSILEESGRQSADTFRVARNWHVWFQEKHKYLAYVFHVMVYVVVVGVPLLTMISKGMHFYSGIYTLASVLVLCVMIYSVVILRRPVFS